MATRVDSPRWRKRRSSGKLQRAIIAALRDGGGMTSRDVASYIRGRWRQVCIALDDLTVGGQVDQEDGRYRLRGMQ